MLQDKKGRFFLAGNSVILKPSEETPLVAEAFFSKLSEHFPDSVLTILHGDGKVGQALVESDIQMIAFTGSQAVGRNIMQRAASTMKRLVMELGGNDPLIVMEDADLEQAARFAVAAGFENSGQMCTSIERVYVDHKLSAAFIQRVTEIASTYQVGSWNQTGVNIGSIINGKQHKNILSHIQDAEAKGATILLGTSTQPQPYIQPTIISGMTPEMKIEHQETFDPVIAISDYQSIDEAIKRANDSSYGLGAVVFGEQGVQQVAQALQAGMVGINQSQGGVGPWVGAKQSGFGYHGTIDGHRQFAQVKVISA